MPSCRPREPAAGRRRPRMRSTRWPRSWPTSDAPGHRRGERGLLGRRVDRAVPARGARGRAGVPERHGARLPPARAPDGIPAGARPRAPRGRRGARPRHSARFPPRLRPGARVRRGREGRDGRRGRRRLRPEPDARRGHRGGRRPDARGAGGGPAGRRRRADRELAAPAPGQGGRGAREADGARRLRSDAHHALPACGRAGRRHERADVPGRGRRRRRDLRVEDRAAVAPRSVARPGPPRRPRGGPALRAGREGPQSGVVACCSSRGTARSG